MTRPPLVIPDRASPDVREALAVLPPGLAVFRMVAHAETAFLPWLALGGALLGTLQLDPVLRELAILQVALIAECDYERVQHEEIAIGVGVSRGQVAALRKGSISGDEFDRREEFVLASVGDVIDSSDGDSSPVARLEAALSAREVIELLLVISYYYGLALLLKATGLEPDPPAAMAVVETAQSNTDLR